VARKYWILIIVSLIVIIFDQWTKEIVLARFHFGETIPVIRGFFDLTHIRNTGAAFGILATADPSFRVPFFFVMPVIALTVIALVFRKLPENDKLVSTALSLVVGGAIGNLVDRLRHGNVVDFLLFHWNYQWKYPAFNVADAAICIGVALLMVDLYHQGKNEVQPKKA
jgi:signal peptidase II